MNQTLTLVGYGDCDCCSENDRLFGHKDRVGHIWELCIECINALVDYDLTVNELKAK